MSAEQVEESKEADEEVSGAERSPSERPSQLPEFDMTYRPEERVFAPHWKARLPSFLYLFVALCVGAVVLIGESSPVTSYLFRLVVTQDVDRVMSMRTFSIVIAVGAVASVVRASMTGVRVVPQGVETRDVHNLFIPRVNRYQWLQMECIILDMKRCVALDLWDGRRAFLPPVSDHALLRSTLERVAMARSIPVRGGKGLDDVPEPINSSLPPPGSE